MTTIYFLLGFFAIIGFLTTGILIGFILYEFCPAFRRWISDRPLSGTNDILTDDLNSYDSTHHN